MIVFFVIKRFYKVLDQNDLFTAWNSLEIVSKIKNFPFGDGFSFLR